MSYYNLFQIFKNEIQRSSQMCVKFEKPLSTSIEVMKAYFKQASSDGLKRVAVTLKDTVNGRSLTADGFFGPVYVPLHVI